MDNRMTVHMNQEPIYDIVFTESFDSLPDELSRLNIKNRRLMVVSDMNVGTIYTQNIIDLLREHCAEIQSFIFKAGEENKNLDVVRSLYESLIVNEFDRGDMLIALGGGVVGDLTGFAAATYLRGIDFVQIPTSLLAQVDSSIGGKTGVDFSSYKNMVGAFHMPKLVYINIQTLQTLPEREFISGMGEIIKHGMIRDAEYFRWLMQHTRDIKAKDSETLLEMIQTSCNIKREIVEQDPKEQGNRALLNLGHTIGHAIEKQLHFELLHGECVAMGLIFSSKLSEQKGLLSYEDYEEICDLITAFQFPDFPEDLNVKNVIKATRNDKKRTAGKIKFILLNKIGDAFIDMSVTDQDMENAINAVYEEIE